MTELSTGAATPAPEPAPPAPAKRRSGLGWLIFTVLLLAAVAAGVYYGWQLLDARRSAEREVAEWRDTADALEARITAISRELESSRERQRSIEARIGENAASARVVRDEVLGIAERAALLEDAVARLAESRERGDLSLRLNEIEFLLQLGEERLRLFADNEATLAAFTLAADALAGLNDPALSSLQQTLSIELKSLRETGTDPRPALRRRIADVLNALDRLPLAADQQLQATPDESRLWQILDRLITVRRISDSQSALSPVERASRIASLRLQLGLALAALETHQEAAWQESLQRALRDFDSLYDPSAAATVAARNSLSSAAESSPRWQAADIGTTLRELRAIRATRSAARSGQALPALEADPQ